MHTILYEDLGAVHKRRPQSGGGGLSIADNWTFFGEGERGIFKYGLRTFWCKNFAFFNIYGVSA